jgi:L-alanine-DL-glutamate epimerase-like enolase superfamily enzyme
VAGHPNQRADVKLFFEKLRLETRHEFNIARAAAPPAREDVWVRAIDDDGVEGWGEAAPNAYYAESADQVMATLPRLQSLLEKATQLQLTDLDRIEQKLFASAPKTASGRAAVSAALLDLIGKRNHQPVWRLLGLDAARAPRSSYTIGIASLAVMRQKVREASSYPILKIKVGTPDDETILAMLREERPDAVIRVDANTGWTRKEALQKLPMLEAFAVELIEQPLPPDDLEGLAEVTAASKVPIIADESCKVAADVERLRGRVHGVNIKLAKSGSMLEAVRIAEAARKNRMQVMIGCMIESTLGIAAAIQLAPLVDYVDLDGAALLARDYFKGPGLEADGRLRFNDTPGLGVELT